MITNSETTVSVASWFEWLKSVINFVPKSIMIDCSPVEINAINQVYGDVVQVLLCHWHIKRAWEKHIKKMVSEFGFILYMKRYYLFWYDVLTCNSLF